jgi:hypothetical protein
MWIVAKNGIGSTAQSSARKIKFTWKSECFSSLFFYVIDSDLDEWTAWPIANTITSGVPFVNCFNQSEHPIDKNHEKQIKRWSFIQYRLLLFLAILFQIRNIFLNSYNYHKCFFLKMIDILIRLYCQTWSQDQND